ncbi:MAG: hypothetical protein WCV69_03210 [Patescibacteria group bacterium]|jgi:hypothetical protein
MEKLKFIILPLFGLMSALVVNYILLFDVTHNFYALSLLPGLIFGIFIFPAIFIIKKEKKNPENTLIWLACCAIAYHASFWVVIAEAIIKPPFSFLVAGFVGGLIMLIGLGSITKISKNSIIFLSLLAGVIAFVWLLAEYNTTPLQNPIYTSTINDFLEYKELHPEIGFAYLYIWWNTLMAMGIAMVI